MSRPVDMLIMLGESEILDDFLSDSRGIREIIPTLLGVLGAAFGTGRNAVVTK